MLQDVFWEAIQEMLKAEMDNHLGYEKHANEALQFSNSCNGRTTKTVRSKLGELSMKYPGTEKAPSNSR